LAIEHIPYSEVYGAEFEDIRRRIPDLTRIRQHIGYEPRHDLDDIIRDVLSWKQQTRVFPRKGHAIAQPPDSRKTAASSVSAAM
jgi:UDP-glucose 4-epimerase